MGFILDSSIVIGSEQKGDTAAALLNSIAKRTGNQEVALSAIGLTELVHGAHRSTTLSVRMRHERFIEDLLAAVEVVPYTKATAFLAGKIDGEQRALGITIPSMDLLIGATALEVGYSLLTVNLRHFLLIPGLNVISL